MISQFVSPYDQRLLGALDFKFPEGTHAVGRLDYESEGLLILTTDKTLTKRLFSSEKKHTRCYVVQVRNRVNEESIDLLRNGLDIVIKQKGVYRTKPCLVRLIEKPEELPEREPGDKDYGISSWLEFTLTEGKNRQIRKMCTAINHRCKRLIRTRIEDLEITNLQPGEVREMEQQELFELLKI
jgi:23S rRNA pseudouridine2457 synthase